MPGPLLNPRSAGRILPGNALRRICLSMMAAVLFVAPGLGETPTADSMPDAEAAIGAIISLRGQITDVTHESIQRRMNEVREKGATVIIFDMDTPGGLVTSSISIADTIKSANDVKTVAWVNPNAHSGGALVAVACEEIVMARSSRIGDSQVIFGGPQGVSAVPDELKPKAYTPVLAEFRASARLRGYDQRLCEAFVIPEREVWWLEHIETGEREFVFRDEKERRLKEPPTKPSKSKDKDGDEKSDEEADDADADTRPQVADTSDVMWKLVETYYDPVLEMDTDCLQPVVRDDQLLEMSPGEAFAFGFNKAVISDEAALKARYGIGEIIRIDRSWSESLALWMTSMTVRGFLMVIILLGAYVEFHTPGVGVPGLVALICLGIFVGAPYVTGLANVWEIIFVALGVLLLLLELFVIPGFGIAGMCGLLLLVIGLLATFVPQEPGKTIPLYLPSLESSLTALKAGIMTMTISLLASLVGMVALSRILPKTALFRAVIPENPTREDIAPDDEYRGVARIGDRGNAACALRPAGKALFGAVLVDVVSQGDFIETGSEIEVVERRGNQVVVRQADHGNA